MNFIPDRKIYKNIISAEEAEILIEFGEFWIHPLFLFREPRRPDKPTFFPSGDHQNSFYLEVVPVVIRIVKKIENSLGVRVVSEPTEDACPRGIRLTSHWAVMNYNEGSIVHYDTGSDQHMPWCNLSCSILLSNPDSFTGGDVHFDDGTLKPTEHHLNALVYSSIEAEALNKHWVDATDGADRWMMLMFFKAIF